MPTPDPAAQRLGELLIAARVGLGFRRRAAFARHLGLTHDRTLSDIETGRRSNFDPSTIAFIERAYGWAPGSIKTVLSGGEPTLITPAAADVGPTAQDDEELVVLYRLPPGLSPRERERAQRLGEASVRAYLETLQDDDQG